MSASAPRKTGQKNPSTKFIKWKGGRKTGGFFEWYDKNEPDEKKRSKVADLSKGFYILDKDLFSITGYDEPRKTNIASNEVRTINDVLIVNGYREKTRTLLHKGTYSELKPIVSSSRDMKYTRSVYIMFEDELCHLSLYGAAFAQWIKDVESNSGHYNRLIKHSDTGEGEKGDAEWKFPIFTVGEEASEEDWDKVIEMDSNILQPYLEEYLSRTEKADPDNHSQGETQFDITQWRHFKYSDGRRLCDLSMDEIREASDSMIGAGDVDSIVFDCISQAIVEFSDALKQWPNKKDRSGKSLGEYTLDEIAATLPKVPMDHPSRIFLLAAKEAKELEMCDSSVDEDDIPF